MKYCKFCGAEIPDDGVCTCPESQNETISRNSGNNKSMIIAGVAVLAGIVIIIGLFSAVSGGGYKKPVDYFFTGFEKCKVSTMAKSLPDEASDKLKETTSDEDLESLISLLELGYGKNIKISYDIEDKKTLDKDEIKSLEKSSGLEIKKAYDLTVDVEFKGKKEEEETSIHLTVAKIKGEGWKLVTDNALSELM